MLDDKPNEDTIETQCAVRAPLWAIIAGAATGAVAGRGLRTFLNQPDSTKLVDIWARWLISPHPWVQFFFDVVDVIAHVLLASIVVVAFARKKDTQPVLSIEDFYGGFFVGAMVGFNGLPSFRSFLTPPGAH